MKTSHKVFFFINSFSSGITIPVLSLILLSHGATLKTLSLYIGIISTIVVITELPSGILTDIYGRKRMYLLSHFFLLFNFTLTLVSDNSLLLSIACVFQGFGKAFSSGTVEIMEIESYIKENGNDNLARINSVLAIIDCIGLAVGSFLGGIIGYIGSKYTILLLICIILEIILLLLSTLIIKEKWMTNLSHNFSEQLKDQFKCIRISLKDSRFLAVILLESTSLGVGLSAVEVYWQPTLKLFLPENLSWILGMISCMGYIGVLIGNKVAEILWNSLILSSNPAKSKKYYWFLRFLLPIFITILGICKNTIFFVTIFIVIYFILGCGNLFENTIFHALVSDSNRASMISISSLFLRGGGIITSILGSMILNRFDYIYIWILLPLIMFLGTALLCYKSMKCFRGDFSISD